MPSLPSAPQSFPATKAVSNIKPLTPYDKLTDENKKKIDTLANANNTTNALSKGGKFLDALDENTAEPGIEKGIIIAAKTITKIQSKIDDICYGTFENQAAGGSGESGFGASIQDALDKGLFGVLDFIASVDLCNVIAYALNQIPVADKFDPKKPPVTTDVLALRVWQIKYKAFQVQTFIDDYYSTYGDAKTGKSKNAVFQLARRINNVLKELLGQSVEEPLPPEVSIENDLLDPNKNLSEQEKKTKDSLNFKTDITVSLNDPEILAAFPELNIITNYLTNAFSIFNRYTDIKNFPNEDVAKAIKTIDDIRTVCISVQNLSTVAGAIDLADRFLNGAIGDAVKAISKLIQPKFLIPLCQGLIKLCQTIITIISPILRFITFGSMLIKLFLLLVKIFWILRKFFLAIPVPNMFTTVGVTSVASNVVQETIKEYGFLMFLNRLKQINEFLGVIIRFLKSLVSKLYELINKLTVIIYNLEACSAEDVTNQILNNPSTLQSDLDAYGLDQTANAPNVTNIPRSATGTGNNLGNANGLGTGAGVGVGAGKRPIGTGGGGPNDIFSLDNSGNASGLQNQRGAGNETTNNVTTSANDLNLDSNGNGLGVIKVNVQNDPNASGRGNGAYVDPKLIQDFKDVRDALQSRADELLAFLTNYFDKKNAKNNTFGPYTIEILTEEVTNSELNIRRRFGIAIDAKGVMALQSDPTYASDDRIIINEVKAKLLSSGLVNANSLGYSQKADLINKGIGGNDPALTGLGPLGESTKGTLNSDGTSANGIGSNALANALNPLGQNGSNYQNSSGYGVNGYSDLSGASSTARNGVGGGIGGVNGGGTIGFGGINSNNSGIGGMMNSTDNFGVSGDGLSLQNNLQSQGTLAADKINNPGQINIGFSGFRPSDIAVMEESMNFLMDDEISIDGIEFIDFNDGLDDPESEDSETEEGGGASGLGLNGFVNSIKGGRRLRRRMRKAMASAQTQLSQNLKESDPSGSRTGKFQKKLAVDASVKTRENKMSPLKESIITWKKELAGALLLGAFGIPIVVDRRKKIKEAEIELTKLQKEIDELKAGTREPD